MTKNAATARLGNDRGIALILSMFVMLALSTVAASMMFLAQTETYSTANYRMMSQARYGAESGIQKATNYLLYTYVEPSTGGADSIANYNVTTSPVTRVSNGQPVILSANPNVASNYPNAAVQTAFNAAAHGTLESGSTDVAFLPYATLVSMEEVPSASAVGGAQFTVQTWQITSVGEITQGTRTAQVEVTATLDTQKTSMATSSLTYGVFATGATCGAITMAGGAQTKSYDSSAVTNPAGAINASNGGLLNSGGNIGTNGNLTESGGATVYGSLSTPRVGVGSCSAGNVTAETASGGATVTGGLVQLPQAVTVTAPAVVAQVSPTSPNITLSNGTACAALTLPVGTICTGTGGGGGTPPGIVIKPPSNSTINWANLTVSGGAKITIDTSAAANVTVNMKDVSLSGGGAMTMTSSSASTVALNVNSFTASGGAPLNTNGYVAMLVNTTVNLSGGTGLNINTGSRVSMNIASSASTSPLSMSGGAVVNNTMDPANFVVKYPGTGTIAMSGGTKQAMVLYAPNSPVNMSGGSTLYGSVVAKTLNNSGGTTIFYDRHLSSNTMFTTNAYQVGNPMLSSFSWKRF